MGKAGIDNVSVSNLFSKRGNAVPLHMKGYLLNSLHYCLD